VGDIGPTPAGEHQEEIAEAAVADAAGILEEQGFACRTEVVRGHPGRTLLELADREGSSLVVAGSRGLGPLRRLALGSVSDALARHADAAFIGRTSAPAATQT
jgi:nucleotide-binding universal stress UspA family protein